ncbi:helicase-related protein [Bathymodiolus thermophilus thioautotrophic gill symbiont]|uniref:Superfamily II DNA and RNA helicase n=1 Tax=Bathymodiolus thermophilus thioautotrophic gill symbiont TaxID=2360 RepID=A0A8H9CGG7_9GAMM|nr:helicase-related protein [Bathymodiolus thermophilus thioautotrophic gill symbiont]CAB5498464.1 Superfamily II DNA and RNA helicase [Bathymodiolus thermophilus thioautotrophic gill symbiont]
MKNKEARKKFVEYIKEQLICSKLEIKENDKNPVLNDISPLDKFYTGLLFPIASEDNYTEDAEEYSTHENEMEKPQLQPIEKTQRYMPPSSAGFSFFISGEVIKLRVVYNANSFKGNKEREAGGTYRYHSWKKLSLTNDGNDEEIEFTPTGKTEYKIFEGKAKINALWRKYGKDYIVTLTLSNQQKIPNDIIAKEFNKQRNEKTLFEVAFKCIVESGIVAEYPATEKSLLNTEEKEIQLRYQDLKTYAVGHGVAANWVKNNQGDMEIWADFMPQVEVPQVTADTGNKENRVLQFDFLTQDNIDAELKIFVKNYQSWIETQTEKSGAEQDAETAKTIIANLNIAKQRMFDGIKLLEDEGSAKIAFKAMNQAMLMQWQSNDKNKDIVKAVTEYQWRPFQLGFILMALVSTVDEDDDYRDTLDLIWFPTGGGKTEAYLGLMAFLFVYRRLVYSDTNGGTVAIMRYTLRLLTTQQFVRANKVIFALELIRQQTLQFGTESFSSGLWVGGATSPNTFEQSKVLIQDGNLDKFVINRCPWCEEKFTRKNYQAQDNAFHFHCYNENCDFGKHSNTPLPCNVVDESLYKCPPTLLLATVDKFARLVWDERTGAFFGKNGNKPPELIIQDELHLISDALGSIVGLYEVGIETALITRGVRVKYIASTATIKNAAKQVQALFAKEMQIFPPSGLRYDDSYFAKTVPLDEKPGRLYVGYLAPLPSRQKCLSPLAAALLSAPIHLFKDNEMHLDNWWTQLIYHGSLKGLSNSSTLYQGNINAKLSDITLVNLKMEINKASPKFCDDRGIKSIEDFQKITDPEVKQIVDKYLPVRALNIKELSSKKSAEENAQIFNALALEKHQSDAVDIALATNMIATGLDVSRLALMIINGQPLTTAEYIQASSRVGRGKVPGVVFINYYKTQARSLSHYENFRSYHDGFYRFVEPSSVTPFTYQARKRALHAALIIAIRHGNIGLLENAKAGSFDKNNDKVKEVIRFIKQRCENAIDNEQTKQQTLEYINDLANEWHNEKDYCENNDRTMVYYEKDRGTDNLICDFDKENGRWKTLQSMRNVENSALIKLISGLKKNE